MEQSGETKQNWTGAEGFDDCFWVTFESYYKIFVPGRMTGR